VRRAGSQQRGKRSEAQIHSNSLETISIITVCPGTTSPSCSSGFAPLFAFLAVVILHVSQNSSLSSITLISSHNSSSWAISILDMERWPSRRCNKDCDTLTRERDSFLLGFPALAVCICAASPVDPGQGGRSITACISSRHCKLPLLSSPLGEEFGLHTRSIHLRRLGVSLIQVHTVHF
jgi:hypothetical protein